MSPVNPDSPGVPQGYERFFGFIEPPFSLAPNPKFLFESAAHAAALAQVAQAIERREPLVVITGEIGTGKTLLCRTVAQRLPRKTFVSVVHDPMLGRDDLLKQLLEDFGLISKDRSRLGPTTRHDLVNAIHEFLGTLIPLRAHAVVIIDEAQHLQPEVLEQIRLLSNIDDERGTMLQIIVVGQRDLEPVLARPELKQFRQRVSRRFRLDPLNAVEVEQYIRHRIKVASGDPGTSGMPGARELERELAQWDKGPAAAVPAVVFTAEAFAAIAAVSEGVPRVINLLCDRALEMAYAAGTRAIDARVVEAAAAVLQIRTDATVRVEPEPDNAQTVRVTPEPADETVKVAHQAGSDAPTAATVLGRGLFGAEAGPGGWSRPGLAVAAAVPVLLAVLWVGSRALQTPGTVAPSTPPSAPPSDTAPRSAPAPAPTAGDSLPEATAAMPPSPGEKFEIVVASFRTAPRAEQAAKDIAALGMGSRIRPSGVWQQVLAGPFTSREQADAAKTRLESAGYRGTAVTGR